MINTLVRLSSLFVMHMYKHQIWRPALYLKPKDEEECSKKAIITKQTI